MAHSHAAQLQADNVRFSRGAELIIDGFTQIIGGQDRLGLVGPNGVGKSTLLQLLAGVLEPESGTVTRQPASTTVGLLTQELNPLPGQTVAGLIAERTGVAAAQYEMEAAAESLAGSALGASDDRYDQALEHWLALGGADLERRADVVLDKVGLHDKGSGSPVVEQRVTHLSGGEQARVGLAVVLLSHFEILLLDEPTNDLDQQGLATLEAFLLETSSSLVVVSHDRRFMDRVVNGVIEVDTQQRTTTFFRGDWSSYREQKAIVERQASERFERFTAEKDHLLRQSREAKRRLEKGVRAAKNHPDNDKSLRNARLERTEARTASAGRLARAADRLETVEKPWEDWQLRFQIGAVGRSGDLVAELREVTVGFGGFSLGPIDLTIRAGERIAIAGPNGSGKTTLIRLILGDLEPDSGERRRGPSVVLGELDQARQHYCGPSSLIGGAPIGAPTNAIACCSPRNEANQTNQRRIHSPSLLEVFLTRSNVSLSEARSTLAKFGLGPRHIQRPTELLSPGERTRAGLAEFQIVGVNTLVLDEPTNHLDLLAIEQLEQALDQFAGTLLIVSHDRAFMETVRLTRTLNLAGGRLEADVGV